jgi:hypothetical protein
MKYIQTLLLMFFTVTLSAQNPTYEQTVEYIQTNTVGRMLYKGPLDSYQRATGHKLTKISIEKNGRIKLIADQRNGSHDFEIVFNIFDLTSSIDYPDGIRAYKFLVHFKGLNVTSGYGITFATENDAIKVARALRHLKTLCSQEGDLFSKQTESEQKPTLSKEETLAYIKKLINNQEGLRSEETDHYKASNTLSGEPRTIQKTYTYNQYMNNNSFELQRELVKEENNKYQVSENTTIYELNFEKIIFENISLEGFYEGNDGPKGYKLALTATSKFTKKEKHRGMPTFNSNGQYNYVYSIEQARNELSTWEWFDDYEISHFYIYMANENDIKRLKKAFDHLTALIKEENNLNIENDPFGN